MNTPTRIDLNGVWRIRADFEDAGLQQRWHSEPSEAEDPRWLPATVPSGWQTVLGVKDPAVAWYRRGVETPRGWREGGARVWLRFDGVATDATVWVNGREVGRHVGNWAPFHFDVTDALQGSEHAEIVVRVDKIPATPAEWIDGAPVFGGHITKGFHDVLSLQSAGIWDGVRLERTGGVRAVPSGVSVIPDAENGLLKVDVELEACREPSTLECVVLDAGGEQVARAAETVSPGAAIASLRIPVSGVRLWSPESPELYTVRVRLSDANGAEEHTIRTGFRALRTGGPNNERLLLNGRPIFLSGILDWGHEPRHISPAPPPDELRERFAHLKRLGFNCVCLCMWYPPEYFFDIADEMGMMLWQEHPVWKPWMGDELVEPFKEQLVKFFRRDANHASVVLVSGSCEHERFNPKLAAWWWAEAKRRLPDRVHQIQTAFFAWTDPTKTDLWDEHTYESAGRWVRYLDDLQLSLDEKEPKPFIMGESVLYTSWPDIPALLREAPSLRDPGPRSSDASSFPWAYPKGMQALIDFERTIVARYGEPVAAGLREQADHYHLQGRKFQMERYRAYANHAGHVQNHLRDVPPCRCGFQDDLGRWRFSPEQTRPWLDSRVLLLETPDQRRGFIGGQPVELRLGMSNFAAAGFDDALNLKVQLPHGVIEKNVALDCPVGEVRWWPLTLDLPSVTRPTRVRVTASSLDGSVHNDWPLWLLPAPRGIDGPVHRLAGLDFVDADDMYPDFEEHAYSNGWGLKVRNWVCPLPNPAKLTPEATAWKHGAPVPAGARVVVAHKLTEAVVAFMERGGRVVHLTSKTMGSMPNQPVSMWGQVPLILADRFLGEGADEALLELLDYDLTRRTTRAVPTGQLGIADNVEPLVRLIWTHDMQERPKLLDAVVAARVGEGLLVMSSLDHSEDAGQWMLHELIAFAGRDPLPSVVALEGAELRRWTVETSQR